MTRMCARMSGVKGASLLEALVALILAGIVTTAIFKVYVNQHHNWTTQEHITDMQQNARAAIDELTRQMRMAGHALPIQISGIACENTNPDGITIRYCDRDCQAVLEHDMTGTTANLRCDGQDLSDFCDGEWVYIFHPDSGGGEFFQIAQVHTATAELQPASGLSQAYAEDAIVLAIQQIRYFVDTSDSACPRLMMQLPGHNAEVYAENIEDMQIRYRMQNGSIVDVPAIPDDVREIRLSLIARAAEPDPQFPSDPYRRRAYNSSVHLRNYTT